MESALRYEITQAIPSLVDQIYPTNAPETAAKPYLVYCRNDTDLEKTLDGYTGNCGVSYTFSIMAKRYIDMKALRDEIAGLLISMMRKSIGEYKETYIKDLSIRNITETYEFNLKMNRGIIDFTVFY